MLGLEDEIRKNGLPWAERPFRELLRLAWPITVSTLSYSTMTLVGTLFVSTAGESALAGIGLGGVAAFAILCFAFGWMRGVKVLVSHAFGAGDRERLKVYLSGSLIAAAVLAAIVIGLGMIVGELMPLFTETSAAGDAARSYVQIRSFGAPIILASVALREYRHGIGESRVAMYGSLAANGVNIALDFLFVILLDQGVAGAAWATNASHLVELVVLVAFQLRDGFSFARPRRAHFASLMRMGLPTGLQFLLEVGSFAALTIMLSLMSDRDVAGHQIAIQVLHFAFLPILAVGEAAAVLVGQAVGARRSKLIGKVTKHAFALASVYAGIWTVALAVFSPLIASAFTDDPKLLELTIVLLWIAAVFQWFDGANIIARSVLRGTGDVRYAATVGIITAWVTTPPLTWLFGMVLGLGAIGGWIALTLEIIVGAALVWRRIANGGWLRSAARERRRQRLEVGAPVRERAPIAADVAAESIASA
jgi:multidrug resistance protein, MATE family